MSKNDAFFLVVAAVVTVGFAIIFVFSQGRDNKACDTGCIEHKYAGGELIPLMKHDICICVPKEPGPAGYFMLKRGINR